MTITALQFEGSAALRTKALLVESFDEELADLIVEMQQLMQCYNGIGLAAPQINVSKRVVTFDFDPFVMINPEIVEIIGTQKIREGCLSFPNLFFNIERSKKILVTWQNVEGANYTQYFSDLQATAIQHEIDHLNGKLFIDHVPKMTVLLEKKKLTTKRTGPKK